jgi:hypothetical protein
MSFKLVGATILLRWRETGAASRSMWIVLVITHEMSTVCSRLRRTKFLLLPIMLSYEESDQAKSKDNGHTANSDTGCLAG